jgi:hypothetical protein
MINYDNKTFKSLSNSSNGDANDQTIFEYQQEGDIVSATYSGGNIMFGHLLAIANDKGHLNMRYHHLNMNGELMTGVCYSIPEIMPDGKIRMHEKWRWTSGDESEGESVIEEV